MNDREMFYNTYGYGGYIPQTMPNPANMQTPLIPNSYSQSQVNDMNERINRIERQIKRLDQRLTRLETPYANTNNKQLANEPDNNMYMM